MSGLRRKACLLTLLAAAMLAAPAAASASRYDPAFVFRTVKTPHFVIYFHQGEERLARRLAVLAEEIHATLTIRMQTTPRGPTHVVLVDQADVANGSATPWPYNTVEVVASPPSASSLIGNTDDWLRLVFAHEYAHVLALDRSEGVAAGLRRVFGRAPFVFPNLFQPAWQIEGVATFEESQVTGRGRVEAGDFAALVAEQRRTGRFVPIDQASSELVPWPGGNAPYAYGGYFYRYLADRFGEEKLAEYSRMTARGYYFVPGRPFTKVFGQSLGLLWRDFERTFPAPPRRDEAAGSDPTRLTFHGFEVVGPRFLPPSVSPRATGSSESTPWIAYSLRNADDFPALMAVPADGSAPPRILADRYGGSRVAVDARSLLFDQLEIVRSVAVRSDLYRFDPRSHRAVRLTKDSRLAEPDVSPDGGSIACVRLGNGVRSLVVLDLRTLANGDETVVAAPRMEFASPDTQFGAPRWSPDGRLIVAERWRRGGPSEIVVIDVVTRQVHALTSTAIGRDVTPTWCPDGRTVLFSSDRERGAFRLYAVELVEPWSRSFATEAAPPLRRVAQPSGGILSPDVSPDGRTVVYVGYTDAGYDLFTMPIDRDSWTPVDSPAPPEATGEPAVEAPILPAARYSPLPTLWPRYWLPEVQTADGHTKPGFSVAGSDVLGRHLFQATVLWRAWGGRKSEPHRGRPDWQATYVYDRWRPAFVLQASDKWHVWNSPPEGGAPRSHVELRELTLDLGVSLPFFTVRHAQVWQAGLALERHTLTAPQATAAHGRNALKLAWSFSNAKSYAASISREQGVTIGVTSEHVRRALGADGNADAFTAEIRGYPRLGGQHAILALRAGYGWSAGDSIVRRAYYLGGSDPAAPVVDFGSDALSFLRGFDSQMFGGFHLAVANVDYRRPIFRVDRGPGSWPIMLRVVHAAGFIDAGNVWNRQFSMRQTKLSVGTEGSVDVVLGYSVPLTLTVGIALTQNGGSRASRSGSTVYARIGRAF